MADRPDNSQLFKQYLEEIGDSFIPDGVDLEASFGPMLPVQSTEGMTFAHVLALKMWTKACTGNEKVMAELLDRLHGKPKQVNENRNLHVNYLNFLDQCIEEDEALETDKAKELPTKKSKKKSKKRINNKPMTQDEIMDDLGLS